MAIVVKTFIGQLFGSPDVQMLEFDPETSGFTELQEEISNLVDGREVKLWWLDGDGDRIRLSNQKQLDFAVKHGLKENVLRVSVSVDWLGLDAAGRRAKQLAEERRAAAREAAAAARAAKGTADESGEVKAGEEDGEGEAGETSGDAEADAEGTEDGASKCDEAGKPDGRKCRKSCRRGDAGKAKFSGYVRTVGEDGVTRERDLTEEEAAHLLRDSSWLGFGGLSPLSSLGSSYVSHPRLHYHRPAPTPLYLLW